jgi:hypothetical protein
MTPLAATPSVPTAAAVPPVPVPVPVPVPRPASDGFVHVPEGPAAVRDMATQLREEHRKLGGAVAEPMSEAVLETVVSRMIASAGAASASSDERHVRAWARLVFSACNEASDTDAVRALPLAPPSVSGRAPPEELTKHRQSRAHEVALERLTAATVRDASAADDNPPVMGEEALIDALDADIEEMDGLMRASMRSHEDSVQRDVSEALLDKLVGELADELATIDRKQRVGR